MVSLFCNTRRVQLHFVLGLQGTRLFDQGLGFGLVSQVVGTGSGNSKAEGHHNAVKDAGQVNHRSPLLVSDTHGLEGRRNGVEQVHANHEHADYVESSPSGVCKHGDGSEPHVTDDFALSIHVQVVFTELEHHKMLNQEHQNKQTGPDHGEGGEGLLALADVEFVVDTATGLLVLNLQGHGQEDMEGESTRQHQFDQVNHFYREMERIEPGQELGVGVVGRLGRHLVKVQELEVATHVAEDEQGQKGTRAPHDLLLTNRGGKILDDPLH